MKPLGVLALTALVAALPHAAVAQTAPGTAWPSQAFASPATPLHRDADVSALKRALAGATITYQVRPATEMPKTDPIAVYVPGGTDPSHPAAYVKVSALHASLLDAAAPASSEARRALLFAAILDVMDSGAAGPAWKTTYELDAQACTRSCDDALLGFRQRVSLWMDELYAEGFALGR